MIIKKLTITIMIIIIIIKIKQNKIIKIMKIIIKWNETIIIKQ